MLSNRHRRGLAVGALLAAATVAALVAAPVGASPTGSPADAGPLAASGSGAASTQPARKYRKNWAMPTHLIRDCLVYENYPAAGVKHRTWHRWIGDRVRVRYNVNGGARYRDPETGRLLVSGWALVRDSQRSEQRPMKNPHYGFIRRACLAKQLPLPPLTGIGGDRQPRKVNFDPVGDGLRVKTLRVKGNATLRDAPSAFVIGNIRSHYRDTFLVGTRPCVVAGRGSWVHGYAPAARRWGWVQASHLPGCHVARTS